MKYKVYQQKGTFSASGYRDSVTGITTYTSLTPTSITFPKITPIDDIGGIVPQSLDAFKALKNGIPAETTTDPNYNKEINISGSFKPQAIAPLTTSYNSSWNLYNGKLSDVNSTYALGSKEGPTYSPNTSTWILLRGTNYPNYRGSTMASTMKKSWSSYHTTFVVDYDSIYQVGHRNKVGYGFGQTANFKCPVQIAVCEYPSNQWQQLRAYYNAINLAKKWATYYKTGWKFNNKSGGIATGDYTYSLYSEVKASFNNVLNNSGLTVNDMKKDVEYDPENTINLTEDSRFNFSGGNITFSKQPIVRYTPNWYGNNYYDSSGSHNVLPEQAGLKINYEYTYTDEFNQTWYHANNRWYKEGY